ncbi:MAG TPA: hypothetical protein VFJ59_02355 [Pseudolabrys sp.]|nr:hypothetical protein [Pseudolabrys sp.]
MRHEVDPRRNVVDIHEEIFPPECLGQPVVQSTGDADRIFSAVIDENRTGHGPYRVLEKLQILTQDQSDHYELVHRVQFAGLAANGYEGWVKAGQLSTPAGPD